MGRVQTHAARGVRQTVTQARALEACRNQYRFYGQGPTGINNRFLSHPVFGQAKTSNFLHGPSSFPLASRTKGSLSRFPGAAGSVPNVLQRRSAVYAETAASTISNVAPGDMRQVSFGVGSHY